MKALFGGVLALIVFLLVCYWALNGLILFYGG